MVFFIVLFAAMFLPVGDFWWMKGWPFLLVNFVLMALAGAYLWRINPDIFVARSKIQEGTKGWDKVMVSILLLLHKGNLVTQ